MSITERAFKAAGSSVSITRMTEHDLLEVVDIEENSGLSRWGWAAYYAELQGNNKNLMLVARVENASQQRGPQSLAGYIVARLGAGELHINNVAVRESYRRRGVGSDLLNHILEEGRRLGVSTVFLGQCDQRGAIENAAACAGGALVDGGDEAHFLFSASPTLGFGFGG